MLLKVNHTTRYRYDAPVDYALQKVRLRPQSSALQTVKAWDIQVDGGKVEAGYTDHYGNLVDLVSLIPGGQELAITATGAVDTLSATGVLGPVYGRAPLWHFLQPTAQTQPGPLIKTLAQIVEGDVLSALHALSKSILDAAPYAIGGTDTHTTAEDALAGQSGVCQDHAQIFVAAARAGGVPARYVSGYLMMTDRVDQDASHAWAEAHIDGLGWVGFDISNSISPDEKYVRLAIGRDARDAAPIEGLRMGNAGEEMIVSVQVQQ